MTIKTALMNVLVAAVRKAARGLVRDFGELEHLQVSMKGPGDFVTSADLRTEKILIEELKKVRPDFAFLTEESGEIPGSGDCRWIIDPIDGTKNFLHAVPYFCISVGVEKTLEGGKSDLIAGVVYNPISDELFMAEKSQGAFLNDRRIRVSTRKELPECLLATGIPHQITPTFEPRMKQMDVIARKSTGVRCPGAGALDLAYVAAGRYDGFWYHDLNPWDMAAGIVLIREAGGKASGIGGEVALPRGGSILATNGLIHAPLGALLTEV
ncbi:MAG: inositol monophosphatase [Alphaproteobacteria bacterium]|nr:inositol monophosphatase [Alphaproteobacteria bacterium]